MNNPYREQAEPSEPGDERRTRYTSCPSAGPVVGSKPYYAHALFAVDGVRSVTIVERINERTVTIEVEGGEQWAVSRALENCAKLAGVIIELEWTK